MFREARSLDWNVYVNNLMHFVFVHIIDLYVVFKWNVDPESTGILNIRTRVLFRDYDFENPSPRSPV